MSSPEAALLSALEVAQLAPVQQAPNGICYAVFGDVAAGAPAIPHMVNAIPRSMAPALTRKAYYFVPLAMSDSRSEIHPEDRAAISSPPDGASVSPTMIASALRAGSCFLTARRMAATI